MNIDLRIMFEDDLNFMVEKGIIEKDDMGSGGVVAYNPKKLWMTKVISLWCMENMSIELCEARIESLISHETVHSVLINRVGLEESRCLDNIESYANFRSYHPYSYPDDIKKCFSDMT